MEEGHWGGRRFKDEAIWGCRLDRESGEMNHWIRPMLAA